MTYSNAVGALNPTNLQDYMPYSPSVATSYEDKIGTSEAQSKAAPPNASDSSIIIDMAGVAPEVQVAL